MKLENPTSLSSWNLEKSPGKHKFGGGSVLGVPWEVTGGGWGRARPRSRERGGRADPGSQNWIPDPKAGSQTQIQTPDPQHGVGQHEGGSQIPKLDPRSQTWIPDPDPRSQSVSVWLCRAGLVQVPPSPCPRCSRGSIPSRLPSQSPSWIPAPILDPRAHPGSRSPAPGRVSAAVPGWPCPGAAGSRRRRRGRARGGSGARS